MKLICLFCLVVGLCTVSCKKQDSVVSVPEIQFVSINPQTPKEYSDDIHIKFSYKDGDGDLGENNANAQNLFITDNRLNLTYKYRIQQLAPSGQAISIQGMLDVVISNTGISDSSLMQDVNFSLYVTDRAGNRSNTITTPYIQLVKN